MNNYYEKSKEFYDYIINNNGYNYISMLWTIYCVNESIQTFDMELVISDNDKEKICSIVLDFWLDYSGDTSISKIADIVVEHWIELKTKDNYDLIYSYLDY